MLLQPEEGCDFQWPPLEVMRHGTIVQRTFRVEAALFILVKRYRRSCVNASSRLRNKHSGASVKEWNTPLPTLAIDSADVPSRVRCENRYLICSSVLSCIIYMFWCACRSLSARGEECFFLVWFDSWLPADWLSPGHMPAHEARWPAV
jgi:hypothetical protein